MAPGRKKGANKAKAKGQLSLGDLVLAKVKGFPAWPAKISQPEDWDHLPDPKKYFVQFFGTQEIAFIAPPDIQAFTDEVKSKLLERCQGKTFRYFTQAVKEICAAFEEVQKQKACGLTDKSSGILTGHEALTADGNAVNEVAKAELENTITKRGSGNDGPGDVGSKAESSVKRLDGSDSEDTKPTPNGKIQKHESPDRILGDRSCVKDENRDEIENGNCSGEKRLKNAQKVKKMATNRNRKCEDGGDASSQLVGKSLNDEPSLGFGDLPGPNRTLKDDKMGIDSTGKRIPSEDVFEPDFSTASAKKTKDFLNSKKRPKVSDDKHDSTAKIKNDVSDKKKRAEPEQGKLRGTRKIEHPAKKARCEDMEDVNKRKTKPLRSSFDEKPEQSSLRQSVSDVKREIILGLGARAVNRGRQALESVSVPSLSSSLASHGKVSKRGLEPSSSSSNNLRVPVNKVPKRRRAVCIYDDDEDEDPKTPIHGGYGGSIQSHAAVNNSSKGTCAPNDFSSKAKERVRDSTALEMTNQRELPSRKLSEAVSPAQSGLEKKPVTRVTPNVKQVFESPSKDIKQILESDKKSPQLVSPAKPATGQNKPAKSSSKVSFTSFPKRSQASSKGAGAGFDDVNSSQSVMGSQRSKPASSVERSKATPKTIPRTNHTGALKEKSLELPADMVKISREDGNVSLISTRTPDNSTSMKNLIAAAQAKRKQAHSESSAFSSLNPSFFNITEVEGKNHSHSTIQPAVSGFSNAVSTDLQGLQQQSSPANDVHQPLSQHQLDAEENEERRASSGHTTVGGSLSGGTEAAVARDAFEGMIETLSRTKESIARATRLAIDCAKYGIANEVVELLIRKLESEPSFHRKVDLFFLLDSITQCSHNQKGIAGASYVPTVQAALPRLLGAAVPTGTGARENRRQCLKVLRLWLERKIFPEALLRRYIGDIGVSNDDATVGFSLRRPSRSERAVDDPLRVMEGMLVDEYGSNASFQLPGLFFSRPFEDEDDDQPVTSAQEADDTPVAEPVHASGEPEACMVTPNDRGNCILEDVDGDLEMEDVSAHPKDTTAMQEKPTGVLDSAENNPPELPSIPEGSPPLPPRHLLASTENNPPELPSIPEGSPPLPPRYQLASTENNPPELPPIPEGSPPLPPESPPSPPPLPSSPSPPPPPPPQSPPLPPPPSSPSPPPPPPPLPTQPPPTATQPPPPPTPASAPLPSLMSQPSIPSHPPLPSQPGYPPQVYTLPQSTYQPPIPHEHRGMSSGNQIVQMPGSTSLGCHVDGKAEFFHPQSSRFASIGVSNSREPSGHYFNPEPSQPNQQFQPSTVSFAQRPVVRPPVPSGHFSYPNSAVQPRPHHSYPHPYPLPSQPDGGRRYVREEPWRMPSTEQHSMDNPSGAWISGRHPRPGPPIVQDGYFRPPPERPPPSNMGFQIPPPSNLPAGHPIPGHGVTQILPSRPDMPPVNCWRPA